MNNNLSVVRISNNVKKELKFRSALVDIPMVELANLFIIEGLKLRNDHLQLLLQHHENLERLKKDANDEGIHL